MLKSSLTALVIAGFAFSGICGLSAAAHASITWDWTWMGANSTGSGTLTTSELQSHGYLVGTITGSFDVIINNMQNNETITDLVALNSPKFSNDNLLLSGSPQLDLNGLAFSTATDAFDLDFVNSEYGVVDEASFGDTGTFQATMAVPEPASGTVFVAALVGLSLLRRRKHPSA